MNKCKNCQNNCEGDYCFRHKPRKPLPKVGGLKKSVYYPGFLREDHKIVERNEFFLNIWNKRPHKSEISGEFLPHDSDGNPYTIYFHHILPKNKYDFAEFDEENIILLSLEEHDQVEMDAYRYEEINKRREYLIKKYNL